MVDLPYGKRAIRTKWVYRNKKDERGIVVRNKARLVAQGYTQEEGIDYDEVFAPVARIEAVRLFLAYASFMNFIVYQMDVKSAFLYGKIDEEVYVCQPPGFEDPKFPVRVYMVEKVLYGLHQAPRAWYETLSTYLLDNGFQIGAIDKTFFIKKVKSDILLVQVYVDDIIFGSTNKELCTEFKKLMHNKFQMSSMASTPMDTSKPLHKDTEVVDVDVHLYRSMIGSLMYLTASRPDIMFIDSPFDLEAYFDSDYAGASLDRKSTIGDKKELAIPRQTATGKELSNMLIARAARHTLILLGQVNTVRLHLVLLQVNAVRQKLTTASTIAFLEKSADSEGFDQIIDQFWSTGVVKKNNGQAEIHTLINERKIVVSEATIRDVLHFSDEGGVECLPNTTIFL
ncbi:putative ribonuclease H-like domain-containing protein [Tanacetum coccineum]